MIGSFSSNTIVRNWVNAVIQQRDYQTNFDGTCFFRFMPSSDLDSFDAVAALHKHFDVEAYVEGKI